MMTDESRTQRIDEFLTQEFGPHGGWTLAVETYSEDLDPALKIQHDDKSAPWLRLGLARSLAGVAERELHEGWESDGEDG